MKVRISVGDDELDQLVPGSKLQKQAIESLREKLENIDAIDAAKDIYGNDDIEIDDDATISAADNGVWVSGWLWVADEDMDEDEDDND